MKFGIYLSCIVIAPLLFTSCTTDKSSVEVTYTKAKAIYDKTPEFDIQEIGELPREIINPGKIFYSEEVILIGEEGEGIHVLDNSDPEQPFPIAFINIPGNYEFFANTQNIYAATPIEILKLDVQEIRNPKLIGKARIVFEKELIDDEGHPLVGFEYERVTEILDEEDNIYNLVRNNDATIYYDHQNTIIPASEVPSSFAGASGTTLGSMNRMVLHNDYLYVLGHRSILTFIDNSEFYLVHSTNGWENLETIYPAGNRLYIGTSTSMEIYSIEDAERPFYLNAFRHARSCDPVLPFEDVIYLTLRTGDEGPCPGDENALVILEVENNSILPEFVKQINMIQPYGMTIIKNLDLLFVAEGKAGLKVFDIKDRQNPALVLFDETMIAYDVIVHPSREDVVLVAGDNTLSQYAYNSGSNLNLLSTVRY